MKKLNPKGFALIGILFIIVVLALVGGAGVYVWHKNHRTKAMTTSNTSSANSGQTGKTDPYAGWKRYTSNPGKFTISYPSSWSIEGYTGQYNTTKVPAAQLTGNENSVLLTSSSAKSDSFGIWLTVGDSSNSVSSTNSALTQIPFNQGTILKSLSNGLKVWEANQTLTVNGHTVPNTCTPFETTSNGEFGFKLNSGKYLDASMSFCYAQGQTTTYIYDQQASSTEFQHALDVLSSIKQ